MDREALTAELLELYERLGRVRDAINEDNFLSDGIIHTGAVALEIRAKLFSNVCARIAEERLYDGTWRNYARSGGTRLQDGRGDGPSGGDTPERGDKGLPLAANGRDSAGPGIKS